jgi:hypothetical protein
LGKNEEVGAGSDVKMGDTGLKKKQSLQGSSRKKVKNEEEALFSHLGTGAGSDQQKTSTLVCQHVGVSARWCVSTLVCQHGVSARWCVARWCVSTLVCPPPTARAVRAMPLTSPTPSSSSDWVCCRVPRPKQRIGLVRLCLAKLSGMHDTVPKAGKLGLQSRK